MPRLVQRHEFMLFIVTVLVSAAIGAANPAFFSAANLFGEAIKRIHDLDSVISLFT